MKHNFNPWWLVGLVDGKGNFEIILQEDNSYSLEFNIRMDSSEYQLLHKLKKFFGCGKITSSDSEVFFTVSKFEHISDHIIPFFEKYTPKSKLKISWIKFRRVHIWLGRNTQDYHKIYHLKHSGFKRESKPLLK